MAVTLIPSPVQHSFRVCQLGLPGRKDLHGAGFEPGDQRLRVEGVIRQQIRRSLLWLGLYKE